MQKQFLLFFFFSICSNFGGITPLHIALKNGNKELLKYFNTKEYNDESTDDGADALCFAVESLNPEIVDEFMERSKPSALKNIRKALTLSIAKNSGKQLMNAILSRMNKEDIQKQDDDVSFVYLFVQWNYTTAHSSNEQIDGAFEFSR